MPYASLDDVKRVIRATGTDDARDAQLRGALEAVESWADGQLRHLGRKGSQIEVYFDVAADATLYLPSDDLVVTKLRVFSSPASTGINVTPSEVFGGPGYDLTDDGRIILRGDTPWPYVGGNSRFITRYQRVEVHYIGTGVIPRAITEGIAYLAAGYWQEGPSVFSGLTSEKIGDYSYTLEKPDANTGDASYVGRASWFLRPFLRKARVSVT